jgi:hypothetical protein
MFFVLIGAMLGLFFLGCAHDRSLAALAARASKKAAPAPAAPVSQ